jgi:peroxiredoxin
MSATTTCPGCHAVLKRPADLPPGKRIRCPECGHVFAPPADEAAPVAVTAAPQPPAAALPADLEPSVPLATPPRQGLPRRGRPESEPDRSSAHAAIILGLILVVLLFLGGGGFLAYSLLRVTRAPEIEAAVPTGRVAPPFGPNQPMGPAVPPGGVAGGGPMGGGMPGGAPLPAPPRIGQAAPQIDGKDLDGKPMKLSDFRGKVVVLDFWGDWCPFCKAAYTYQRELVRRMEGRSFVLLGVNCDDTAEQAKLVVKNHRITWRSWWDGPRNMSGQISQKWGVQVVPSVFVIDTQGTIRQHYEGVPPEKALEQLVDSLLPAAERGRPRWLAQEALLDRLAKEVEVGPYRLRPPADSTLQRRQPEGNRQVFLWTPQIRLGGNGAELEVTLTTGKPDKPESPEEAIEKGLEDVLCLRQDWLCPAAERGEVNGLIFHRVHWSGRHRVSRKKVLGFLYVATDGDTRIQIAGRGSLDDPWAVSVAEAAALSFARPAK